jgi:hypothetical protein
MILFRKILLTVGVLLTVWQSSGQEKTIIDKVDVDLVLTVLPRFEYRGGETKFSTKSTAENHWLMVKVEYSVDRDVSTPVVRGSGGRKKVLSAGIADGIIMETRVLLDTKLRVDKEAVYCMFTGRTEFFPIRRDGNKHLALMFVPAKTIDCFSRSMSGSQVRRAALKDFKAEVVFSSAGAVIARGYCNVSGRREFEEICRGVPDELQIVGGVLPRSRTPWVVIEPDVFDPEK